MPFKYRLVFEIAQRLQAEQLTYLQSAEPSKSIEVLTNRVIDSWSDLAFSEQNIFANISDDSTSIRSYKDLEEESQQRSKHLSTDWRFGAIEVSGMGMNQPDTTTNKSAGGNDINGDEPPRPARSKSFLRSSEYLKGRFIGYGVIRLYRDSDSDFEIQDGEELYEKPTNNNGNNSKRKKSLPESAKHSPDSDTESTPGSSASISDETVLAILAVPSYLTPYDFLGFIGSNARESVSHFRMIRTAVANRYMVLLKFRDADRAHQFYKDYNGKLFNSMEAETCHVVFVSSVQFKSEDSKPQADIPYLLQDPFTVADDRKTSIEVAISIDDDNNNNENEDDNGNTSNATTPLKTPLPPPPPVRAIRRISQPQTRRPVPPPTPALTELPTCPVCLERMDATTTGLLTIPCQHTFHCQCLSKWQDGSCPVCRYSQRDTLARQRRSGNCAVCHASENLWICLICGHMGCGRYDQAHAYDHYSATGHCFAMDVESQRVWDYASDGYVHRLLQNQVDGKLVELPSSAGSSRGFGDGGQAEGGPRGGGFGFGGGGGVGGGGQSSAAADVAAAAMKAAETSEKKLDDVGLQFAQTLSSQLDSQRDYYETLLVTAADKASSALRRAVAAELENSTLRADYDDLKLNVVPTLQKDLAKTKARAEKIHHLYEASLNKFQDEKLISEQTVAKLNRLELTSVERDAEMIDLKEQVRDLMFFHEAQAKLQDAGEDVQQGQITVGPSPSKSSSRKKGKKR